MDARGPRAWLSLHPVGFTQVRGHDSKHTNGRRLPAAEEAMFRCEFSRVWRRTKPTLIYRRTRNLRAVHLLLGHSKLESTVRYLGMEVGDALEIAEQTEV